jgi:hypothetical protein
MARQFRIEFDRDQNVFGYELLDVNGEIIDISSDNTIENIATARNLIYIQNNGDAADALQSAYMPNIYHRTPIVCAELSVFTDVEVHSVRLRSDDTLTPQNDVGMSIGEVDDNNTWISVRQLTLKQQKEHNIIFVKLSQSTPANDRHVSLPVEPDNTRLAKVRGDVQLGRSTSLLDVMALQLGTSALAVTVINTLIDGGGYDELRLNGISSTNAIKVMSIYNQTIDLRRIETEKGINFIKSDSSAFYDFNDYLISLNSNRLAPAELNKLYSDVAINNAVYDWYRGKVSVTV